MPTASAPPDTQVPAVKNEGAALVSAQQLAAATTPLDVYQAHLVAVLQVPFGAGQLHNRLFPKLIRAQNDGEAVCAYLKTLKDASPHTERAYRREIELFLRWLVFVRGESLSNLMFEDLASYRDFQLDPPANWMSSTPTQLRRKKKKGDKGKLPHYDRRHASWRPLRGPRNLKTVAYAMTVLCAMFEWLRLKGWLAANVIDGNGWTRAKGSDGKKPVKYLKPECRAWIARWLAQERVSNEARAQDQEQLEKLGALLLEQSVARRRRQLDRYEHVFRMAYYLGLRRADLEHVCMGSFRKDPLKKQGLRWLWEAERKGDKITDLVAAPAAIAQLNRYRASFGLSPLPAASKADTEMSIVLSLEGRRGIGEDRIYVLLVDLFAAAADLAAAAKDDPAAQDAAKVLRDATPHWIRHTFITDLKRAGADGLAVRDLAGHEDEATTNEYSHSDRDVQETALAHLQEPLPELHPTKVAPPPPPRVPQ